MRVIKEKILLAERATVVDREEAMLEKKKKSHWRASVYLPTGEAQRRAGSNQLPQVGSKIVLIPTWPPPHLVRIIPVTRR